MKTIPEEVHLLRDQIEVQVRQIDSPQALARILDLCRLYTSQASVSDLEEQVKNIAQALKLAGLTEPEIN